MKKTELFLGLLVISLAAGLWILSRPTPAPIAAVQPQPKTSSAPEVEAPLPPIVFKQSSSATVTNAKSGLPKLAPAQVPPNADPKNSPASPDKEPLHDPAARDALALVGLDPYADQYWLDAIFDTSLPDSEREDLMEDLNETGFADPKNLTPDDLPLIVSRLEIIDAVLPETDDFMAEHLLEAQKDLADMLTKATQ